MNKCHPPRIGTLRHRKQRFTDALLAHHADSKKKPISRLLKAQKAMEALRRANPRQKGTLCARIPIDQCPIAKDADRKIEDARISQIPERINAAEARRQRRGIEQTRQPKSPPIIIRFAKGYTSQPNGSLIRTKRWKFIDGDFRKPYRGKKGLRQWKRMRMAEKGVAS